MEIKKEIDIKKTNSVSIEKNCRPAAPESSSGVSDIIKSSRLSQYKQRRNSSSIILHKRRDSISSYDGNTSEYSDDCNSQVSKEDEVYKRRSRRLLQKIVDLKKQVIELSEEKTKLFNENRDIKKERDQLVQDLENITNDYDFVINVNKNLEDEFSSLNSRFQDILSARVDLKSVDRYYSLICEIKQLFVENSPHYEDTNWDDGNENMKNGDTFNDQANTKDSSEFNSLKENSPLKSKDNISSKLLEIVCRFEDEDRSYKSTSINKSKDTASFQISSEDIIQVKKFEEVISKLQSENHKLRMLKMNLDEELPLKPFVQSPCTTEIRSILIGDWTKGISVLGILIYLVILLFK